MTRRLIILGACALAFALTTAAQEIYTNDEADYAFELPNATWRAVPRAEGATTNVEFIYGDRSDGLLRIRKEIVDAGVKPADVSERDRDTKLRQRHQSSFVDGRTEPFPGRLNGVASSYEYTQGGKPMAGRVYYLQADPRTVYVLHFTGSRPILLRARSQTDFIARSFRIK